MKKLSQKNEEKNETALAKTILYLDCVKILDWDSFVLILEDLYRQFPNKLAGDTYELNFMKLPRFPERQYGIVFHGDLFFGIRGILGFLPLPSDNTLFRVYIRSEKLPLAFVDLDYSNKVSSYVESYLSWMGSEILKLFPETTLVTKFRLKGKTIERHKKAWKRIRKIRIEYKDLYENGEVEFPNPKMEDYVTGVNHVLDRPYGERTIRKIIKEGEAGELD